MDNKSLICNSELDIIFVPFSPVSETDKFEVRVQIQNSGASGEIPVEVYLDKVEESSLAWQGKIFAEKGRYAYVNCFPDIVGRIGSHNIVIRFSGDGVTWTTVEKPFKVRTHAPNLLEGAFIMFGPPVDRKPCSLFYDVKKLTDAQWEKQMDSFNELGFKMIIPMSTVQFEFHEKSKDVDGEKSLRAHYPSKIYPKSDIKAKDPVKAIFEAAERNGQKIFLPFGCNYRVCAHRMEVMKELWERYGHYESFYGWYQSYESHFSVSGELFGTFLKLLEEDRKMIQELSPAKPLMVSVLCGQDAINDAVGMMLSQKLCKADIITPMDMVGMTGRLGQLKINACSFSVLKDALKGTGIHLWGNCESFDYGGGIPISPRFKNGGFDGQAGFVQQIETIRPYSEKLVTFMATGMFAKPGLKPEIGGEKAVEQYRRYKEYMTRPRPAYKNIALGRTYAKSAVAEYPGLMVRILIEPNKYGFVPDESNSLSTDGYIYGGRDGGRLVDKEKIYGYKLNSDDEFVDVEILFDLEQAEQIDMLRVAEGPLSPYAGMGANNPDASPDSIIVELGDDLKHMTKFGELSAFVNGWAGIVLPFSASARFVRFIFYKAKNPDYADGSLMLINEIEICQKY